MQNKLKPATTGVIQVLNQAKIRTIMATGDNVLTAISVGRECNIIDAETEVFLGDVKKENGVEKVFWKSTKTQQHRLEPGTLEPNRKFYEDEKKRPGHGGQTSKDHVEFVEDSNSVNDVVQLEDFDW
jgi:magnesium-transporting ATPase (P-type)